jgi:hypothetical protein
VASSSGLRINAVAEEPRQTSVRGPTDHTGPVAQTSGAAGRSRFSIHDSSFHPPGGPDLTFSGILRMQFLAAGYAALRGGNGLLCTL